MGRIIILRAVHHGCGELIQHPVQPWLGNVQQE
jgi:hypothetical protein